MSTTALVWDLKDPTVARIEDQINWYDRKSSRCQKIYKRIKVVEIIAAALIPFLSALHISSPSATAGGSASILGHPYFSVGTLTALLGVLVTSIGTLTALLGVLITVLEGILQLQQYQQTWVTYRSTCEALQHEKFTYIAGAGVYAAAANPHALLAERAETIGSQENSKWASLQQPQKAAKAGEQAQ